MKDTIDYKQCLALFGLSASATKQELQVAYRKAVKLWHPDRFQQSSDEERKMAEARMREINTAYDVLVQYHIKHGYFPGLQTEIVDEIEETPVAPKEKYAQRETVVTPETDAGEFRPRATKTSHKGKFSSLIFIAIIGYVIYDATLTDESVSRPIPVENKVITQKQPTLSKKAESDPSRNNETEKSETGNQQAYLFSANEQSAFDTKVIGTKQKEQSAFDTKVIGAKQETAELEDNYFTNGDTPGRVYEVQGVPSRVDGDIWYYGNSKVYFNKGRVDSWTVIPPDNLKVKE